MLGVSFRVCLSYYIVLIYMMCYLSWLLIYRYDFLDINFTQ